MNRRARRVLIWSGGVLAAFVLVAATLVAVFMSKFYLNPTAPHFPPAQDIATAQRQDLDHFTQYFELNRTYAPQARAQAATLLTEERSRAGAMSTAQFDLGIARVVALADNGHSRVNPGPLSRRHNRLPCRLYRFDDGYWIVRARPTCRPLLGSRVLRIDGRPVDAVAEGMYPYIGGPKNHFEQFESVFFLESPELLNAAGFAAAPDRVTLRVALRDGSERELSVLADPPDGDAPRVYSDQYLSPAPIDKEGPDWEPVLPPASQLPFFLRAYTDPFQSEYWSQTGTFYAQFRSNEDEPGHPIRDFVRSVEAAIAASKPRVVIIDLRLDQGGNFLTTASFMKRVATLSSSIEHVYVITSAWTFSAGIVSLALLKEHGGSLVTVVGTAPGDRTRFWAEGGSLTLPNSKLSMGYATGMHDYSHPCFGERGCFWVLFAYPTHIATFEPDVAVTYTFDDYMNLRDPVLDRVLALAAATKSQHPPVASE